jgi:HEXXH motif-containing protein
LIDTHRLPEQAFAELAAGGGSAAVIGCLREAQRSKHAMLLHAISGAARDADPAAPGTAAFLAGYQMLARIQAADPGAGAWLLDLPHLGGWAHDCLLHLEQRSAVDFAYLAYAAAAAGLRAGIPFELDVPVREGRVLLPGLGCLIVPGQEPWIRLRCDGDRLAVGDFEMARHLLVPDDGSGHPVQLWRGTPVVRAVADGLRWDVLLETCDPYLDRYTLPMSADLTADELEPWRHRVQSAWEVLVRHHRWTAEPIAAGVSVIVPLTAQRDTDLISATTQAAFGAFATSWPPDPVIMAETLVHEFQHIKLCGLMDMVPLVESAGEKVYAPWRQDPRPASGLLQGVYAHLGIARFWSAQRHAETDSDDSLRAQALLARWRPAIELAVSTLLRTGCLTQAGERFAGLLLDSGRALESEAISGHSLEIAAEVALDHRLTWQIRHLATDAAGVTGLATAYRAGASLATCIPPRTWIEEDRRKVGSVVRSRLLNLRYLAPARYRELCADGVLELSEPDRLLASGQATAAVQAYRDVITGSAEPQPEAWIGLALALHRLPPSPLQTAFATSLVTMFEVHACLGARTDPLDLASWFA